ncbi:MAG: Tad domain-containing protein, partial [Alphaproteobacteria bacterium]|nr:Tad domain-containing protein [Alphaproteobacteria bacterium]
VFIGTMGLAVDVAGWQAQKRELQSIVDAAALGGALERLRVGPSSVAPAAILEAQTNGYLGLPLDDLQVYYPPATGIRIGAGDSVEVTLQRQTPTLFSHIIMPNTALVSARAVAVAASNNTCVYALNQTAQGALTVTGAAVVNLDCGVFVNSEDEDALVHSGAGCLIADPLEAVGGDATACAFPEPTVGMYPIEDPLEALQTPAPLPICTDNSSAPYTGSVDVTLDPCVFTGQLTFNSTGTLHFNPGLYVFDGAGITFSTGSTVTGTGVHFYLTENNDSPSEKINIQANANITLTAGTTNDYGMQGVLIYHDRNAGGDINHNLAGGANMDLDGILYFPAADLHYEGGSTFDTNASIIIADEVTITGGTALGDLDGSAASTNLLLISSKLVE